MANQPTNAELFEKLSTIMKENHTELKEKIGEMENLQKKTIKKVIVNSRQIEDVKKRQMELESNMVLANVR